MKIVIIDGQGGKMGKSVIEQLKKRFHISRTCDLSGLVLTIHQFGEQDGIAVAFFRRADSKLHLHWVDQ